MDKRSFSVSQSCCRDEVLKQQVCDLDFSMSFPDREEGEVNQEKRTSAALILLPAQRQESGCCRGYRLEGLIYGKIYFFLSVN